MSTRLVRLSAVALALMVMMGGTGVVLAAVSSSSGKAQTAIKVVREDSSTATTTATSTTYVDIVGASANITVAAGTNALLVARFQGHGSVIQAAGCIVRILADGTSMEPDGNYPFMTQANVSGSQAGSGAIERSMAVGPGTYTVKAQLRLTAVSNVSSQCQMSAWHLAVERHKR